MTATNTVVFDRFLSATLPRGPMRAITLSLTLMLLAPLGASAGELVMFESPVCEYCEMWEEEVGVIYHNTNGHKE